VNEANDKRQPPRKRLLSVEEAGEYLGRSAWAVRHLIRSGSIPEVRLDRRVFIDIRDLDALIERNKRRENS
jgi:excisionase family DNA binding protein